MTIDKPGLVRDGDPTTSGHHAVKVDYEDGEDLPLGAITIGFGGPFDDVPAAKVTWTQNIDGEDVYTFDGWISVWAKFSGGNENQVVIKCPGQQVVVTLHR